MLTNPPSTPAAAARLGSPLKADAMLLFDAYQPGIKAGSYRMVFSQSVEVGQRESHHYFRDQEFLVRGPRFAIDPRDTHSFFPPEGGRGDFARYLPHVVFRNRSLPWERAVGSDNQRPNPWLALLVLSHDELDGCGPRAQRSIPRSELNNTGNGLLGPDLRDEGEDPNTPVPVVDLPLDLFLAAAPNLEELSFLAHLRCVAIDEKVPLAMHAAGDFSVLVANRFPRQGNNVVLVVSLEGWDALLTDPHSVAKTVTHVRLVNPLTWRFINDARGSHSLKGLLAELDLDSFGRNVASDNGSVTQKLRQGFVPTAYQPRGQKETFAWYRGPLRASPLEPGCEKWNPVRRAEDALRWDQTTGTLDISHSAAWQLGRLTALSSGTFSAGLRTFVEGSHNAAEAAQRLVDFLKQHPPNGKNGEKRSIPEGPPPRQLAEELLDWLARLMLLYPVPYHYLVAHPSLLPPDSLRFFHLDNRWLAALAAGALSTGIQSRRDAIATDHETLLKPLSQLVFKYRMRLLGLPLNTGSTGNFLTETNTGFLLRSPLVSQWPGLEVEVTTNPPANPNLPALLRMDHLGGGVLFGLVRGHLTHIQFKEPREGLRFGIDTEGNLTPRLLKKEQGTAQGRQLMEVGNAFQRKNALPGVMDIGLLASQLGTTLKIPREDFGSAFFALQMIRRPEAHKVKWSPSNA